ncbi:SIR2 family protein [Pediococcus pentosaceus]|uniref:SIR2 family protein n=1 Tax=Pediococcus pentosaceus TaxID=1255 RepID=UPI0021E6D977|nr:SIR2 family protein [Pediococcus pentosaceus]MCV3330482.1 SIR2 family protein [Pediococcus pentosaceus]
MRKKLRDSTKRPILFVGSGISQRYFNSPTWSHLLKELFQEIEAPHPYEYYMQNANQNHIKVADKLVSLYQKHYWKDNVKNISPKNLYLSNNSKDIFLKYQISLIIKKYFAAFNIQSNPYKDEIEALGQITPQLIITTNYDNLLETIFPKYTAVSGKETLIPRNNNESFNILKIHGSVDNYSDIVIDKEDYNNFDKTQLYLVSKLITYFIENPIIFLGYSVTDPDMKKILNSVKKVQQFYDTSPILNNIWFVDWLTDAQEFSDTSQIKYIPVNGTETVGVNYLQISSFTPLFETLKQDSVDVDALRTIEHTIYDIVKSSSITKLNVDVANIEYMRNSKDFLNILSKKNAFINISKISDPEQLASIFILRPSEVAERVFGRNGNWQRLNQLIDNSSKKIGGNIRKGNNQYHVELSGVTLYSEKAVSLLKRLNNGESIAKIDINPIQLPN